MKSLGAYVIAATADDKETAVKLTKEQGYTFPIAHSVTEGTVRQLDPWWSEDSHGRYIQPMEFLVTRGGSVFASMYATGPIGRMHVDEVLTSIHNREHQRLKGVSFEANPANG